MSRVRAAARSAIRGALAVAALAATALATACAGEAGDGGAATTTTTERDDGGATTTLPTRAPEEDDVLAAYAASWEAFRAVVNGEAREVAADHFEADQLAAVLARADDYEAEGLELRGRADLAPAEVTVAGSAASLVDCQIDHTYAVERATGEIVIPAGARPQEVLVDLVRSGGRWKVTSVDYGAEGSCAR